jgi:hypothetical protein
MKKQVRQGRGYDDSTCAARNRPEDFRGSSRSDTGPGDCFQENYPGYAKIVAGCRRIRAFVPYHDVPKLVASGVITAIWIAVVCLWHVDKKKFPWEIELNLNDFALKYAFGDPSPESPASKTHGGPGSVEADTATLLKELPICKIIVYGGLASLVAMSLGAKNLRTTSEQLVPEGVFFAEMGRH